LNFYNYTKSLLGIYSYKLYNQRYVEGMGGALL